MVTWLLILSVYSFGAIILLSIILLVRVRCIIVSLNRRNSDAPSDVTFPGNVSRRVPIDDALLPGPWCLSHPHTLQYMFVYLLYT